MDRDTLLTVLFLALLTAPFVVALSRANELFVIDVTDGSPTLRRGRAPKRLLSQFADVLRRPPVKSARLRGTLEGGRPMLRADGVPPDQLQRLRNVLGLFTRDQIRTAPRFK
jgi:hypothetical protein